MTPAYSDPLVTVYEGDKEGRMTIDCDICGGTGMLSQERYCPRCEGRGTLEVGPVEDDE